MDCPRCHHANDDGARFCGNCGSSLTATTAAPERSFPDRARELIGGTRGARLATAATLLAIAVAVIAFLALPADQDVPHDSYTVTADAVCVDAKRQIAAAGQSTPSGGGAGDPGAYAAAIVPIVAEWRSTANGLRVPADRAEPAAELDDDLLEVLVQAGTLVRIAREGNRASVLEQARRVDEASGDVEAAIGGLGLDDCAALKINPASS